MTNIPLTNTAAASLDPRACEAVAAYCIRTHVRDRRFDLVEEDFLWLGAQLVNAELAS